MSSSICLVERPVPNVEIPSPPLPLPTDLYRERLAPACLRARQAGLDILAIYGDREHCANLAYLTGFDPRFEEALLLISTDRHAKLLVGNECMGYTPDPLLDIEIELYQEFSLLGQPRDRSRPLRASLAEFGLKPGVRVGAVGWKYFDGSLIDASALDVPSYLADLLRDLCGQGEARNATALFMNARDGMRTINEPAQIAHFEYAANMTAAGMLDVLTHLHDGLSEWELERYLDARGLPLSCHRMISGGKKVQRGLSSASTNRFRAGDPYVVAFEVNGGLTCRAGFLANGLEDLPEAVREFYPQFAANYFAVVATWYESIRVGVTGGDVFGAVESARDGRLFTFAVNPGHQLHLDEWLNSPFSPGNANKLASGMALQVDIIPQTAGPFCCINAEDGAVLADEALRASLARATPDLWQRVQRRRSSLPESFDVNLHERVLPLSDLTAWLPPYAMDLSRVLAKV